MGSKMPRLICVTSGRDGVGRTSFVLNAGIALAKMDFKVLLVDADMGISNLDVMLGLMPSLTLEDYILGDAETKDIVIKTEYRIDLIPATSGLKSIKLPDNEKIEGLGLDLASFAESYDFILVDSPGGASPRTVSFLAGTPEVIFCISTEDKSLTDTYALIKELKSAGGKPRLSMLSSIVRDYSAGHDIFRKLSLASQRFADASIHYIGPVVMDEISIPSAVEQVPLIIRHPASDTARCYRMAASTLLSQKPIEPKLARFFSRLIKLTADDSNPGEIREISYDDSDINSGMGKTMDAILSEQRKTRLLLERLIGLIDAENSKDRNIEV